MSKLQYIADAYYDSLLLLPSSYPPPLSLLG